MPAEDAWYDACLARALPGSTQCERDWRISKVRGMAAIHAAGVLHGELYIWPDPERSAIGRRLRSVGALVREVQQNGLQCDL